MAYIILSENCTDIPDPKIILDTDTGQIKVVGALDADPHARALAGAGPDETLVTGLTPDMVREAARRLEQR